MCKISMVTPTSTLRIRGNFMMTEVLQSSLRDEKQSARCSIPICEVLRSEVVTEKCTSENKKFVEINGERWGEMY